MSKVFLATPTYGGMLHEGFHHSVLLAWRAGVIAECATQPGPVLPVNRNMLVHLFLASECDRLLFVDADQTFAPEDVTALVEANRPIVGGPCAQKAIDWNRVAQLVRVGIPPEHLASVASTIDGVTSPGGLTLDGKVHEVEALGTGFLMIKREVFERIAPHVPEVSYCGGPKHRAFFDFAIEGEQYLPEDWRFCKLAREHRFKIFAHTGVSIGHLGTHEFMCRQVPALKPPPRPAPEWATGWRFK